MRNPLSNFIFAIPLLVVSPALIPGCANTRTIGAQTDDAGIKMRVAQRLTADPDVRRFKIDVDVIDAVVTLRGQVEDQAMIDEAVKLAENTEGVQRVTSKLTLTSEDHHDQETSDLNLKTAVGTRLSADPDIRRLNVDVDVINGVVYLSGVVNDEHAKETAERIASGVDGVSSVENELQVDGDDKDNE